MCIVINAANAYAGGGATLALNFLDWFAATGSEGLAVVPDLAPFRELSWSDHFRPILVPPFTMGGVRRPYFDAVWLPRLCRQVFARRLLTLGSIGPARVCCDHAVLVQNSYYVYGRCEARRRLPWRMRARLPLEEAFFRRSVRNASVVIAQSRTIAGRLEQRIGVPASRIRIVGNGVNLRILKPLPPVAAREFRLLTVSRYYTHKNFELLTSIALRMKQTRAGKVRFITTVDPSDGPAGRRWLRELVQHGVVEMFENIGRVPYEELPRLYARADALIYPTLLESSTAAYVEAMHFGVPIITSDLDFAREACGEAALYADPMRPEAWLAAIHLLSSDPGVGARLAAHGRSRMRGAELSWDKLAPRLAAAAGLL